MFSQDGSLLPSSYADARFIDAVIFSKALTDYVHSKGLKFGLYTARGSGTCQGRPGSLNHELIDAATYCDWGIDYIKIDGASDSTGTAALVTAHIFARARAQTTYILGTYMRMRTTIIFLYSTGCRGAQDSMTSWSRFHAGLTKCYNDTGKSEFSNPVKNLLVGTPQLPRRPLSESGAE